MDIKTIIPLKTNLLPTETQKQTPGVSDFGQLLTNLLQQPNQEIHNAERLSQDFALGKNVELHQVVLAAEKADLALQMTIQVRNKVVEAYQEIMRMQV